MGDHLRRNHVTHEIDTVLAKINEKVVRDEILTDILTKWDHKAANAYLIIENLAGALNKINQHEHQSGLFRTLVVLVFGSNVTNIRTAELLNIHRKSIAPAKRRRLEWNEEGNYISLHVKP